MVSIKGPCTNIAMSKSMNVIFHATLMHFIGDVLSRAISDIVLPCHLWLPLLCVLS